MVMGVLYIRGIEGVWRVWSGSVGRIYLGMDRGYLPASEIAEFRSDE